MLDLYGAKPPRAERQTWDLHAGTSSGLSADGRNMADPDPNDAHAECRHERRPHQRCVSADGRFQKSMVSESIVGGRSPSGLPTCRNPRAEAVKGRCLYCPQFSSSAELSGTPWGTSYHKVYGSVPPGRR